MEKINMLGTGSAMLTKCYNTYIILNYILYTYIFEI